MQSALFNPSAVSPSNSLTLSPILAMPEHSNSRPIYGQTAYSSIRCRSIFTNPHIPLSHPLPCVNGAGEPNKSTQLLIYQRFALSNPVLLSKQNLRKMRPFCRFSRHFRHVLAQNRRRPLFTAFTRTASAGAASFPPRSEARTCQWSAQSSTARLPRCAVRVCPQPARQRCRMPPA